MFTVIEFFMSVQFQMFIIVFRYDNFITYFTKVTQLIRFFIDISYLNEQHIFSTATFNNKKSRYQYNTPSTLARYNG